MAFTDPNRILIARELVTDIPPNKRIDINGSDAPNGMAFYTGDMAETFPGVIQPNSDSTSLSITHSSPLVSGHAGSSLVLGTGKGVNQDSLDMGSQNVSIAGSQNIELNGPSYGVSSLAYGLISKDGIGPYVDFNAPRIFLRDTSVNNSNGVVVSNGLLDRISNGWQSITALSGMPGGTGFVNGWTDVAGARFGAYKDAVGNVHIRGTVISGTAVTIMTMPTGWRPSSNMEWTMRAGTVLSAVQVNTLGVLTVTANFSSAAASGIAVDTIQFPTA